MKTYHDLPLEGEDESVVLAKAAAEQGAAKASAVGAAAADEFKGTAALDTASLVSDSSRVVALHDFNPTSIAWPFNRLQPLALTTGQVIQILHDDGSGWSYGHIEGHPALKGYFPLNYTVKVPANGGALRESNGPGSEEGAPLTDSPTSGMARREEGSDIVTSVGDPSRAVALHDFDPAMIDWPFEDKPPLPLTTGHVIQVLSDDGGGWPLGQIVGQPDKKGYFPESYTARLPEYKVLMKMHQGLPVRDEEAMGTSMSSRVTERNEVAVLHCALEDGKEGKPEDFRERATSTGSPSSRRARGDQGSDIVTSVGDPSRAVALHDFDPATIDWPFEDKTPLPFTTGQVIQVLADDGGDWPLGQIVGQPDKKGYFPKSYTTILPEYKVLMRMHQGLPIRDEDQARACAMQATGASMSSGATERDELAVLQGALEYGKELKPEDPRKPAMWAGVGKAAHEAARREGQTMGDGGQSRSDEAKPALYRSASGSTKGDVVSDSASSLGENRVIALWDFDPAAVSWPFTEQRPLPLTTGQVIQILNDDGSGWALGHIVNSPDVMGYFPLSYTTKVVEYKEMVKLYGSTEDFRLGSARRSSTTDAYPEANEGGGSGGGIHGAVEEQPQLGVALQVEESREEATCMAAVRRTASCDVGRSREEAAQHSVPSEAAGEVQRTAGGREQEDEATAGGAPPDIGHPDGPASMSGKGDTPEVTSEGTSSFGDHRVIVLYDFDPTSVNWPFKELQPLPLTTGQVIEILDDDGSGWAFGHVVGQPDFKGYFPENYTVRIAEYRELWNAYDAGEDCSSFSLGDQRLPSLGSVPEGELCACGGLSDQGAAFCVECGQPLNRNLGDAPAQPARRKGVVDPRGALGGACGFPNEEGAAPNAVSTSPHMSLREAVEDAEEAPCPEVCTCGTPYEEGMRFCMECGQSR